MQDNRFLSQFEAYGTDSVRQMAPNWDGEKRILAYLWLKSKEEEFIRRIETNQAKQDRATRIAKNAANMAAMSAVIAMALAIFSIFVSSLVWLYPRR
jgi:hypothetical protein